MTPHPSLPTADEVRAALKKMGVVCPTRDTAPVAELTECGNLSCYGSEWAALEMARAVFGYKTRMDVVRRLFYMSSEPAVQSLAKHFHQPRKPQSGAKLAA